MIRFYSVLIVMVFSLSLSGCAYRQIMVPEVVDSEFAAAYRNDLKTLASDEFQGRKPGTPGGKMTQEYLISSFKSMGLEPGNNGSYLQEVKLILSKTSATGITLVSSDSESLNIELNTHILAEMKGVHTELSLLNKTLVFVGFGSESEEFGWHDYADIDVNGKLVVILRSHAGFAANDSSILSDPSSAKHGSFSTKFKVAKSHGALGAIIIFDSTLSKSKYYWKQWSGRASKGRNSLYDGEVDSSTQKLEAILNLGMGKQLLALAGYDYDSLVVAAYTPGFKAFDLGITLSGEFKREDFVYSSNNVLGLIRGSKRPDEVVIYTAHWDHLGMGEAVEGDSIYNGTADNGTGTASILSLARAFMAQPLPPKRSILFMGYTAEEMGLLGSKYYADNPVFPLGKSVASINIDMLNFAGETHDLIMFGSGKSDLDEYARRAAKKLGMHVQDDLWPQERYYYRSDHISLARKGLPSMSMDTGIDSKEHGKEWGMEYHQMITDSIYHKVTDEYSEDLNVDGIMQYLQVVFDVGYTLANSSKFPNWKKDDEFRPIRDASRSKVRMEKTSY